MTTYFWVGITQALVLVAKNLLVSFQSIKVSRDLHSEALATTLNSPLGFFHTKPSGTVLNKFSRDTYLVDVAIPESLDSMTTSVFHVAVILIFIISTIPTTIPLAISFGIAIYLVQKWYRITSNVLNEMEASSKGSIYTHFSETMQGVEIIRGYGQGPRFMDKCVLLLDNSNRFSYTQLVLRRWLGIRLHIVSALSMFSLNLLGIFLGVPTVLFGLMSQKLSGLTLHSSNVVRELTDLGIQLGAMDRIVEYIKSLETEHRGDLVALDPQTILGCISFINVGLEYPGGPRVLSALAFKILPGERMGIVGRTGCGKSSVASILLKLISTTRGQVLLDDTDIRKIDPSSLRTNVVMVPQDPFLFAESIRFNLDPRLEHEDNEIWCVLDKVGLKTFVSGLSNKLDHIVDHGFSSGQCRVICLARGLLTKAKILILDEISAGIDVETIDRIRCVLNEEFANRTMIIISHHSELIVACNKVLALDQPGYSTVTG